MLPSTGEVVSLVRTEAEAHHVARECRVFTVTEVAILIEALGNGVLAVKHMTGEQMLHHVAAILAERSAAYGDAATSMAAIAARWSITLGHPVTPAQVVLCLIDLKLTRLQHNPKHQEVCDLAGYAAVLQEVNR